MLTFSMLMMLSLKSMYLYIPLLSGLTLYILMKSSESMMMMMNSYMLMDKLAFIMITLSIISTSLILLSSNTFLNVSLMLSMILMSLIMTFISSNLFMFYIMFEIVLIPTLIMITSLGNQPERLQAGMYLILYTITASLPLLVGILMIKNNFNMLYSSVTCFKINFSIMFIMAFLVKMPMFIFHLWLPKAHVEAPLEGSMILAAVLLKLGGYGIIRLIPMLQVMKHINHWIISISMTGAMMTSMNCIRQKDLKSLIAYSSVAHMGMVLASLFTMSQLGLKGAIIMMLAHGLSSSALFLLVNMVYSKYHTRNIVSIKGLMKIFPNLTFWWFIFLAINISAPPSINLASELFMLTGMMFWQPTIMMMMFVLSSFMASIFSINLLSNIIHNMSESMNMENSTSKMFLSLFVHLAPLILLVMKLEII